MSETPRSTRIEFSRCEVAPPLTTVLDNCVSLSLDTHLARLAVSNGMSTKDALDQIRENGPITTSRDSEVDNQSLVKSIDTCLKTISMGKCSAYQKLAL